MMGFSLATWGGRRSRLLRRRLGEPAKVLADEGIADMNRRISLLARQCLNTINQTI